MEFRRVNKVSIKKQDQRSEWNALNTIFQLNEKEKKRKNENTTQAKAKAPTKRRHRELWAAEILESIKLLLSFLHSFAFSRSPLRCLMHVYQWLIIHFAPFDHSLIYIVRLKTSHKNYQEKPVVDGIPAVASSPLLFLQHFAFLCDSESRLESRPKLKLQFRLLLLIRCVSRHSKDAFTARCINHKNTF